MKPLLRDEMQEPGNRILILDNEFPPLGGGTGVANYHLMQEFDRDGIACDLITSSRTKNVYEEERFGDLGRIYKVPVDNLNIHHATNVELMRYVFRGSAKALQLHKRNGYRVCLALAGVPAGAMAFLLKRFCRLPYIVSLRGPDVPGFEKRYENIYPILKPLLREVWRYADVVTAISEKQRQLAWQTFPGLPITIIPNGVDTNYFKPPEARKRDDHHLVMICVARLIERKGQQYLLQAVSLLHDRGYTGRLRLMLVGTGDMELQLKSQCIQLGIQDVVSFMGFRHRVELPELYNQADLFVLPSFYEGMSNALLEAMSSGLPVVVTDTGGTDELVGDNGRIVPWADPVALADVIEEFLKYPQLCQTLGMLSRQVACNFSWQATARAHNSLFQTIGSVCSAGKSPKVGDDGRVQ